MNAAGARLRHERRLLCLGIGAAILAVAAASALTLLYLRGQAEARVAATTENLARSMVLTFDGILDAIDVALLASADEVARQNGAGRPDRGAIDAFLLRQQQRLPVVPLLRATNAGGDLIYGQGATGQVNLADRPYFAALRGAPLQPLYVSAPQFGKLSQKWVWPFARRINGAGGAFDGVVLSALDIDQLHAVMASIKLSDGASIVLRDAAFAAVAGRMGAQGLPLKVGDTALSPELRAALARNRQSGTYSTTRSVLASSAHTFSYQRSAKYGFYVWVGESEQGAMAPWRRQAWTVAGLAASFALLASGFLLLMGRAWRRQEHDVDAIAASDVSLREAHEIADIGTLSYDLRSGRWHSSDLFDGIVGIDAAYPRDRPHLLRLLGRRDQVAVRRYVNAARLSHAPFDSEQMILYRPDGQRRWVHARGKISVDANNLTTLVCTIQDITQRKQAEDEIRRLAYYDSLTGLPNRRLLLDRLDAVMAANTGRARHGALLLLDLDHFKVLNETAGHERGDLLLKAVALRLRALVRGADTVARLGGDEFAVLACDLAGDPELARTQAALLAETLRAALARGFDLDGMSYTGSPSIGITLFAGCALARGELTKRADTAMYQAKAAGRNTVRFFDPAMQAAVAARQDMERDLRQSLADGDFLLHYQVQVDGRGRARGAEVLLRWQHPRRGMVSPGEFIPLAEDSGLILPLGRWVLESACAQLARWAGAPATRALTLAVNVSASQFSQAGFVDQVLAVLDATGAEPRRLKLELTEGLLLENTESVIATIAALKRAGISISLDDFGTGFSSLSYLKRLPLDQLKIDQSFVRDLLTDATDVAIVRTIVALGQSLGMEVIAEGVESAAQRDALAQAGCHQYQGYFFGRPLPLERFEQSLREAAPLQLAKGAA